MDRGPLPPSPPPLASVGGVDRFWCGLASRIPSSHSPQLRHSHKSRICPLLFQTPGSFDQPEAACLSDFAPMPLFLLPSLSSHLSSVDLIAPQWLRPLISQARGRAAACANSQPRRGFASSATATRFATNVGSGNAPIGPAPWVSTAARTRRSIRKLSFA